MKISIAKSVLLTPLNQITKVSGSKVTEIYNEILLNVSDSGLEIVGGNGHVFIKSHIPFDKFETVEQGKTTATAKKLLEIVKKSDDTLEIESKDKKVIVKSGKSKFELASQDADQYPTLPQETGEMVKVIGEDLKRAIKNTVFATADNASTPVLEGVLFNADSGKLTATATDRHRLSHVAIGESDIVQSAIIRGDALDKLKEIVEDTEAVELYFGESQLFVKTKDYTFYSQIMDGQYPDVSKVIPQKFTIETVIACDALQGALERVNIMAIDDKTNVVKMAVQAREVVLTAKVERGSVVESVEAEKTGDDLTISFNAKFMLEALRTVETEKVRICFTGAMSPFIIKGEGNNNADLQLILPYRTTQ